MSILWPALYWVESDSLVKFLKNLLTGILETHRLSVVEFSKRNYIYSNLYSWPKYDLGTSSIDDRSEVPLLSYNWRPLRNML